MLFTHIGTICGGIQALLPACKVLTSVLSGTGRHAPHCGRGHGGYLRVSQWGLVCVFEGRGGISFVVSLVVVKNKLPNYSPSLKKKKMKVNYTLL